VFLEQLFAAGGYSIIDYLQRSFYLYLRSNFAASDCEAQK
jgi:hypothetical protein